MRRLPSLILIAACFIAGFALAGPANADARAKVGIADQKSEMFGDQRFRDLKVKYARVSVPWDALRRDFTRVELENWMSQARSQGVRPLITIQRSRVKPHSRPSVNQYRREVKRIRAKYKWVKDWSAWNEPNLEDKKRPKLIASYYKTMRSVCKGCKVLASDLVDNKDMVPWVKKFLKYTKGKQRPKYWGLHNYVSINSKKGFSTKSVRDLGRIAKGSRIWLTETGGLVKRRNKSKIKLREGTKHASSTTRKVLKRWGGKKERDKVERIYLYHWNSSTPTDTWDSAFVGADGKARPSLGALKSYLKAVKQSGKKKSGKKKSSKRNSSKKK